MAMANHTGWNSLRVNKVVATSQVFNCCSTQPQELLLRVDRGYIQFMLPLTTALRDAMIWVIKSFHMISMTLKVIYLQIVLRIFAPIPLGRSL